MRIGRRKRDEVEVAAAVADDAEVAETSPEVDIAVEADAGLDEVDAVAPTGKSAPADREDAGPLDETEANPVRPYVDLGGVKILPREGLHLRLEVEEGSQRVVAVGLDYDDSTLQVQPFAAPRSTGLWHEIRAQIADQIERQGGTVTEVDGPFGPELRASVPVVVDGDGGVAGARPARFIGVDGPRWFLRGVIAGKAADSPEDAEEIEELFRSVVVVRGTTPMPPRDLIPLHMPKSTQSAI
ncbi:DUF3710 domain-containing protein [Curtobacterium sp. MMLR14_010]|jgi:hypothetical protein|uniref:DUF3710 domain-containing protein n=1 Tax=Curtobacterium sp. MMLR14_010 TaxID=1898743 RepID=UPI0009F2363E|nr:DUF3710 domain-containing protein [Curtobacterium sp. MMLR14_010]